MLKVVIVEDNTRARALLGQLLEGEEILVTAAYQSGEDALANLNDAVMPDIVLIDIGLPGISGIELCRQLKAKWPGLDVVMQTVFEDEATILQAIKAGATGYVLKSSRREEIVRALVEVKAGGSYLSGAVARKVLDEFRGPLSGGRRRPGGPPLSGREQEILDRLVGGASYKAIAAQLGLSVHTVNNHIRKIYEKMHVNSRGEAAARVLRQAQE